MPVLLVSNATKVQVAEVLQTVREWLDNQGIQHRHIYSEQLLINNPYLEEQSRLVSDYDLVVSFGGDGTILRVSRMIGDSQVPLLACNFGGMGFLSAVSADGVIGALQAVFEGNTVTEQRTLAEIEVTYENGSVASYRALNEAVISRGNFGRIVSLDLYVNDCFIENARGDGVLVSTATGSTAYALSAGGPLVNPLYDGLVVAPISPHSLKAFSMVTGPKDVVVLKPSLENVQRIVLFLDGEVLWSSEAESGEAGEGDGDTEGRPGRQGSGLSPGQNNGDENESDSPEVISVAVRPSPVKVNLVRLKTESFYSQVARTFFGE